jgi:hypothetical protein
MKVTKEEYLQYAAQLDKHSEELMSIKGEEYSLDNDFLAMENMLAGMTGLSPAMVTLVMAGKHITAMAVILQKVKQKDINLTKWDERIRDGINLIKICSALVHAEHGNFDLHLGKEKIEKIK